MKPSKKVLIIVILVPILIFLASPYIAAGVFLRGDIIACINAKSTFSSEDGFANMARQLASSENLWFRDHSIVSSKTDSFFLELLSYSASIVILGESTKPKVCIRNNSDYQRSAYLLQEFVNIFDSFSVEYALIKREGWVGVNEK